MRVATTTDQTTIAWALISALTLLVLVSAANVSNLLLARSAARQRELAIRTAVGATRRRLVMQLLAEAMLLTLVASVLGIASARALITAFVERAGQFPYWVTFDIEPLMLLYAGALGVALSAVAGVAPALKATRSDVNPVLSRGSSALTFGRFSAALIVLETTIAVGLLGATFMLGRAVLRFDRYPPGLPEERGLIAQLYFGQPAELQSRNAPTDAGERRAIRRAFLLMSPVSKRSWWRAFWPSQAVQQVSLASAFPGNEPNNRRILVEQDAGRRDAVSRVVHADERYLSLLNTSVIRGRAFSADDIRNQRRVALVNQTFACRSSINVSYPLARRVRLAEEGEWAGDCRHRSGPGVKSRRPLARRCGLLSART